MIKAILLDDDLLSLKHLENLLLDIQTVHIEEKFTHPAAALQYLEENKVDVVFLDIELPEIDGIEFACRVLDLHAGEVVFVTASWEHAVQAFDLNALDYLIKPVSAKRLEKTLDRLNKRIKPASQTADVRIRCFGRFGVLSGADTVRFRTEKAEELLAFLIDNRGSSVGRSRIIDSLWGDFEGDRALTHFNTTLYYIKKAFQAHNILISIHYDRGSYFIDLSGIDCDYIKFIKFFEEHEYPGWQDVKKMEETADLYTGEYLTGWESDWVVFKRMQIEEKYIGLMHSLAEYYKSIGVQRKSIKWLNDALLYQPLSRSLNYKLIEALLHFNERILAKKQYEIYKTGLAEKYQLEPDGEFEKLFENYKE